MDQSRTIIAVGFLVICLEITSSGMVQAAKFDVTVTGIKAIKRADSDLIPTAEANNRATCVASCEANPDCAFVSYDASTCQSFIKTSKPFMEPVLGYAVQGATKQNYTKIEYQEIPYETLQLDSKYPEMRMGIFGLGLLDHEVCKNLCQIHPQCNAVTASIEDREFTSCKLKKLTYAPQGHLWVHSYVSTAINLNNYG